MTWLSDEQSVHGGRPIELYAFVGPSASFEYYYTSHPIDVSFGGKDYISQRGIARDAVQGKRVGEAQGLEIVLPTSLQVVQDYAFAIPPYDLTLTLYRIHGANSRTWWTGRVNAFAVQGSETRVLVASLFEDALTAIVPNHWYTSLCNHRLYDSNCGLLDTDHDVSTTVSSVSADGTQITLAGDGGNPDQWARGGFLKRDSDGERRLILDHTGNVMTVAQPFKTIASPNPVTLFAGCDHNVTTCRDKFSNVLRFGGFPYIPGTNIFLTRWGVRG